eukprot:gnl/TRDRNA2_/TRDRNA2_44433_c0_seq1.p2 gnl/TRDRNA2_/TRDRNA2_44433_c0~~gnl/TRDRNA2_/TRDRNA2_44433_c0_seq1.p2  ORF type:complete len:203 (-),score=28.97 gnl/TRDRNA2_/TRDRNA2_44433_c0_seq1:80-637(-)
MFPEAQSSGEQPPPSLTIPDVHGGNADLPPGFHAVSVEDRAFLEEFGRRISMVAGVSLLVGGGGFYGMTRALQWRRKGLWTFFGATSGFMIGWYSVVNQERERVAGLAKKLQLLNEGGAGSSRGPTGRHQTDAEVLARLFPAPPDAVPPPGAQAFGGTPGNIPVVPPPRGLLGSQLPGLRPPGTG